MHPGGLGPVFAEAVVTGLGAALLSWVVGSVLRRIRSRSPVPVMDHGLEARGLATPERTLEDEVQFFRQLHEPSEPARLEGLLPEDPPRGGAPPTLV